MVVSFVNFLISFDILVDKVSFKKTMSQIILFVSNKVNEKIFK